MAGIAKRERLYEGKAKIVYSTDDPDRIIVFFKDAATAFNGQKKGTILGKGAANARISTVFFEVLEKAGVPTHFIGLQSDNEMVVKPLEIIPVEVVVRNVIAGSLAKRLGKPEGASLRTPVLEFYYKSDELGDPMINEYHVYAVGMASEAEMREISRMALKVNEVLREFLAPKKMDLIDFKLEFGRYHGSVILGDEISPDTCRFWDTDTGEKLDKDRFRRDLGRVEEAYQEVLRRITPA